MGSTNSKRLRPLRSTAFDLCSKMKLEFFARVELAKISRPTRSFEAGMPIISSRQEFTKHDAVAIVGDHHAFVQRFEEAFDLLEPFRLFDVHGVLSVVQAKKRRMGRPRMRILTNSHAKRQKRPGRLQNFVLWFHRSDRACIIIDAARDRLT